MRVPDVQWPPTREYWRGLAEGQLRLPRCAACDRFQWYPRPVCAACGGREFTWTPVSATGEIYSFTVVCRVFPAAPRPVPFAVLQIVPDDAGEVLVLANLDDDHQIPLLEVGARVEMVVRERTDDVPILCAVLVWDPGQPSGERS